MMLVFNSCRRGSDPFSELSFSNSPERYVTHCKTNRPEDGDPHSELKTRTVAVSRYRNHVLHRVHRVVYRPAAGIEGLADGSYMTPHQCLPGWHEYVRADRFQLSCRRRSRSDGSEEFCQRLERICWARCFWPFCSLGSSRSNTTERFRTTFCRAISRKHHRRPSGKPAANWKLLFAIASLNTPAVVLLPTDRPNDIVNLVNQIAALPTTAKPPEGMSEATFSCSQGIRSSRC